MNCPECGKEMEFGQVQAIDGALNILNQIIWYPEEDLNKRIKKNGISLRLKAEAYYCNECMKVVSIFDEK